MTSLQSIVTRSLKDRQSSAAPNAPEAQPLRTQPTKNRADWLRHFFPSESQETLMNFANLFASEKDMQDRALQLKREGKDVHSEVSDWSYVNSKHQSLRSRKPVEEPKSEPLPAPVLPERREVEQYHQERRGGTRRVRRGRGAGRYAQRQFGERRPLLEHGREETKEPTFETSELPTQPVEVPLTAEPAKEAALPKVELPTQELPKQVTAKPEPPRVEELPKVEPKAKETVAVPELPISEKPEPVRPVYRENKPYNQPKSFGPKKWVKKQPASNPLPPPSLPAQPSHLSVPIIPHPEPTTLLDDPLKEAEAQAQKMTLELVDQSDESMEHSSREVGVQTEREGVAEGTQTEAGLIWREGIPCVLVPLASMEGVKVPLTMLGNPAGLFHS